MLVRLIFYCLLVYLLYKVIFDLIIPVYRTTKQVKKGFRDMQNRMNETHEKQQGYKQASASENPLKKESVGDYIDFEEIK